MVRSSNGISGDARLMAYRMPAEWEAHEATWIAWPHHEPDWPGKLDAIPWVYAEIVRALAPTEMVHVLCQDAAIQEQAGAALAAHGVAPDRYLLHLVPTDRVWLRDSAPTVVTADDGAAALVRWRFNAWAKYDNYARDARVGDAVARITGLPVIEAARPDGRGPAVLEGGAIETNGAGVVMVTEECLLSDQQIRNPGLDRDGYEQLFRDYLGARQTLWLGAGCAGDDTHGHVDDVARFVAPDIVVLAFEPDPADDNHASSEDNLRRLQLAAGEGAALQIVTLPYPSPVTMNGQRLPASYANFYIANGTVIVPTFNDPHDRDALAALATVMPNRRVVGIHAVDLVWGYGTLHCLTQQQPAVGATAR